jgi:hypothetical protein
MTVTQGIELLVGAGGVGGAVKIIGQLTRIAVAIEGLVEWREKTDEKLTDYQSRLDKAGL